MFATRRQRVHRKRGAAPPPAETYRLLAAPGVYLTAAPGVYLTHSTGA